MKSPLSKRTAPYTKAFTRFLRDPGITGNAKVVFLIIKSYAGPSSNAFPSVETLMAHSAFSKSSVQRALRELKKMDLIVIRRRANASSVYLLDDERWVDLKSRNSVNRRVKSEPSGKLKSDTSRRVKSEPLSRTKDQDTDVPPSSPHPENIIPFSAAC